MKITKSWHSFNRTSKVRWTQQRLQKLSSRSHLQYFTTLWANYSKIIKLSPKTQCKTIREPQKWLTPWTRSKISSSISLRAHISRASSMTWRSRSNAPPVEQLLMTQRSWLTNSIQTLKRSKATSTPWERTSKKLSPMLKSIWGLSYTHMMNDWPADNHFYT